MAHDGVDGINAGVGGDAPGGQARNVVGPGAGRRFVYGCDSVIGGLEGATGRVTVGAEEIPAGRRSDRRPRVGSHDLGEEEIAGFDTFRRGDLEYSFAGGDGSCCGSVSDRGRLRRRGENQLGGEEREGGERCHDPPEPPPQSAACREAHQRGSVEWAAARGLAESGTLKAGEVPRLAAERGSRTSKVVHPLSRR